MGKPEVSRIEGPHYSVSTCGRRHCFSTSIDAGAAVDLLRSAIEAAYEAGKRDATTHPAGSPYHMNGWDTDDVVIGPEGPDKWMGPFNEDGQAEAVAAHLNRAFQLGYDKGRAST